MVALEQAVGIVMEGYFAKRIWHSAVYAERTSTAFQKSFTSYKTKAVDPQGFAEQVEMVCTLYAYTPLLRQMGGHVVSCDELTAIQALERMAPTVPMQPGQVERREFEYIRRGVLQSLATRAAYLQDAEHRIQFVYVPKHTSWLNQAVLGARG